MHKAYLQVGGAGGGGGGWGREVLGSRNDVLTTSKAIRWSPVLEMAGNILAVISPASAGRVQC